MEVLTGGDTQAGFEYKTLQKASAAWRRWCTWQKGQDSQSTPYQPTPILLSAFFKSVSKKGPTAAQGVFTSFEWLRKHAGLELLPHAGVSGGALQAGTRGTLASPTAAPWASTGSAYSSASLRAMPGPG